MIELLSVRIRPTVRSLEARWPETGMVQWTTRPRAFCAIVALYQGPAFNGGPNSRSSTPEDCAAFMPSALHCAYSSASSAALHSSAGAQRSGHSTRPTKRLTVVQAHPCAKYAAAPATPTFAMASAARRITGERRFGVCQPVAAQPSSRHFFSDASNVWTSCKGGAVFVSSAPGRYSSLSSDLLSLASSTNASTIICLVRLEPHPSYLSFFFTAVLMDQLLLL